MAACRRGCQTGLVAVGTVRLSALALSSLECQWHTIAAGSRSQPEIMEPPTVDVETFRALRTSEGSRLLADVSAEVDEGAASTGSGTLALSRRLRRTHPPALVAAALTQARLRARAREKFGADAGRMYFTAEGLEQATRMSVAAYRAERYRARAPIARSWVDLCCGLGGDLIALARAGLSVEGVEREPLAVEMARANLEALRLADGAGVRHADATDTDTGAFGAAFCDPARRTGRGRIFDPAAFSPPLPRALELVRVPAAGGVKTAPGIPHDMLPADAEAEWISDGGELKEAALWVGTLASGVTRRATLLPSGKTLVPDPGLGDPPVAAPMRYLYDPDSAVLRAGLVANVAAALDGALLDREIAYVTGDRLVSTPYARAYEITEALPFSLKRLRAALRQRRVGAVTIMKRGSAIDVERLRRQLRLAGPESATVVLTRVAGRPYALLAQPRSS